MKNYKNSKYYRCEKCGRLTPHNLRNRCSHDKCNGLLVEVDPDEILANNFYRKQYKEKVFEMFEGEEVTVKLECKNKLMKYVIDRFGMKVKTEPAGDDTFYCYSEVHLSPTFYGWVFGFRGDIKILEPEKAAAEFHNMVKAALNNGENKTN